MNLLETVSGQFCNHTGHESKVLGPSTWKNHTCQFSNNSGAYIVFVMLADERYKDIVAFHSKRPTSDHSAGFSLVKTIDS